MLQHMSKQPLYLWALDVFPVTSFHTWCHSGSYYRSISVHISFSLCGNIKVSDKRGICGLCYPSPLPPVLKKCDIWSYCSHVLTMRCWEWIKGQRNCINPGLDIDEVLNQFQKPNLTHMRKSSPKYLTHCVSISQFPAAEHFFAWYKLGKEKKLNWERIAFNGLRKRERKWIVNIYNLLLFFVAPNIFFHHLLHVKQ